MFCSPLAVLFFIVVLWRLYHVNVGIVSALFIGFCRIPGYCELNNYVVLWVIERAY